MPDLIARRVAEISPSPPLGAERVGVRWGIPAVPSSGATHLTLPSPRIKPAGLRLTPRRVPPSPPAGGRRGPKALAKDKCQPKCVHALARKRGSRACPWLEQGVTATALRP